MKRDEATLVLVIALILVAGLALVELSYSNQVPSSSAFALSASSQSVRDLNLTLSVNATIIHVGHSVSIGVAERNTLPQANNVSSAKDWPLTGLAIGPCGPLNGPMGIQVMKGYYVADNVTDGKPIELYNPAPRSCPMILSEISAFDFQPSSDVASVIGGCSPNPCFTQNMSSTISAGGYWSSNFLHDPAFSNFGPGAYTIAAGDEWGTLAVLHFLVK